MGAFSHLSLCQPREAEEGLSTAVTGLHMRPIHHQRCTAIRDHRLLPPLCGQLRRTLSAVGQHQCSAAEGSEASAVLLQCFAMLTGSE